MNQMLKDLQVRRERNAMARMADNAKIDSLSAEQHEALADLCKARHEFHCNMDSIAKAHDYNGIEQDLVNIGIRLNNLNIKCNCLNFSDESDFIDIDDIEFMDMNGEDYDYDEEFTRICAELGDLNRAIEDYLRQIDKTYGTNYAPTGLTRI